LLPVSYFISECLDVYCVTDYDASSEGESDIDLDEDWFDDSMFIPDSKYSSHDLAIVGNLKIGVGSLHKRPN